MTATATATKTATTIDAAEANLRRRVALPDGTPDAVRRGAVARMIHRVGAGLAQPGAAAGKTLGALRSLEALSGLDNGALQGLWLTFRALSRGADSDVAAPRAIVACAASQAMAGAFGAALVEASSKPAFAIETAREALEDKISDALDPAAPRARLLDDSIVLTLQGATHTLCYAAIAADPEGSCAESFVADIRAARAASRRHIGPLPITTIPPIAATVDKDATFSPYRVSRMKLPSAHAHPTPIVESIALASVATPAPTAQPFVNLDAVRKGVLSEIQLEAVVYAVQAHETRLPRDPLDPSHQPGRRGFLVGHGTGVGKGRIIAGVIADSWVRGRRRHIWISESARLIEDARRDWQALGGKEADIIDIRNFSATAPLPPQDGVLFMTYAALRAEHDEKTRWRQAAAWFADISGEEGVLAFDEAQNLRNSTGLREGGDALSLQGRRALDLQRLLPEARVLYVSATSASDIPAMGFAERLGLWGPGTAFPDLASFVDAMNKGGVNALEMVARDMKAMGLYLAGNLSFEGVHYRRLPVALDAKGKATQNDASSLWGRIIGELKAARTRTGLMTALSYAQSKQASLKTTSKLKVKTDYARRFSVSQIRMERARFFQALLASLKTPTVIEEIRQDTDRGDAAIIQLTNTFSATAERSMDEVDDAQMVDATPRDIMLSYLMNHFPVVKCALVKQGHVWAIQPVLDPATGEPQLCQASIAMRDKLREAVLALDLPDGPLEQLFAAFPASWIAEATGRKRRLVTDPSGVRRIEERESTDATREIHEFMNDQRKILVFSAAGAVGATYSASLAARNQRMRRHYVLQPGWRADMAIQGMGRSHRSNQRQAPEYILPMTDLWADLRMVSRIASRMRALGALTRGMRSAAGQGFFTDLENFENEFAENAWGQFLRKVAHDNVPGMALRTIELETTLTLTGADGALLQDRQLPDVTKFLNALSAMSVANQERFGRHFSEALDMQRIEPIRNGDYDPGIETIEADALIKLSDTVIYHDPLSGADTRLVEILQVRTTEPTLFQEAEAMVARRGAVRSAQNYVTGRVALLSFPVLPRLRTPSEKDPVLMVTPSGPKEITRGDAVRIGFKVISLDEAEALWDAELAEMGTSQEETLAMVTGAMLPIWDKMPRSRAQVVRLMTDAGEPLLGRLMPESYVTGLKERLATLQAGGLGAVEVVEALESGGMATLANGWLIEAYGFLGRRNRRPIYLMMPQEDVAKHRKLLDAIGVFDNTMGLNMKVAQLLLPEDPEARAKAVDKILAVAPAVSLTGL